MQQDGLQYVTIVCMDSCLVECDAIMFVVYAVMACTGPVLCVVCLTALLVCVARNALI
jgi:hypothetical protein